MKRQSGKKTLLVIDDDKLQCDVLTRYLGGEHLEVLAAHTGGEGMRICAGRMVDVILLDQKLPDGEGVALCQKILANNEQAKIIFITAYPSMKNAISAMKEGAYDYLSKPFELEELDLAVERALTTLELEKVETIQDYQNDREKKETVMVGSRGGLAAVHQMVEKAAATDAPVLITGETGVGKNVVAKTIHYLSRLGDRAFIGINCSAIPENLIEAELFGFEKGTFTGATSARKGLFEMAEGGTLFLDEIATLPLHMQSKLLGVLDEKQLRRLGGQSAIPVTARIISATNVDVENAVQAGGFREDLYYRIHVIRIHIPPLRERLEDIPDLCRFFVSCLSPDVPLQIPDEEISRLMQYPWPGNVREFKNIIERSIILRKENRLHPSALINFDRAPAAPRPPDAVGGKEIETLDEVVRQHICHTLEKLSGNQTRTASALGISRSTLKRKIKEYGI